MSLHPWVRLCVLGGDEGKHTHRDAHTERGETARVLQEGKGESSRVKNYDMYYYQSPILALRLLERGVVAIVTIDARVSM